MMKEINKNTLKKAIVNLPVYAPKAILWDKINEELTIAENEKGLHKTIEQLPSYNPPEQLWDNIESALEAEQKPRARVFSIQRWAAVAAVFVAVTIGTWMFYNATNTEAEYVTVTYSEEKVATAFLNVDWEEDEDAFKMVAEFCKSENVVCKQPAFKILTEELDELNAARNELKDAMDQYGNDPELIAQLTIIEHERSGLLKQIIKQI